MIAFGDAVRAPETASSAVILPPQPDRAKGRQQDETMSRAVHQALRRQGCDGDRPRQGDAVHFANSGSDRGGASNPHATSDLQTL